MKYCTITFLFALIFSSCGGGDNRTEVGLDSPEAVKAGQAATPDAFDASFADGNLAESLAEIK